jgi:hypothetical protein
VTKTVDGESGALKVFGWGSVSVGDDGALIIDHHRDVIEPRDLEAAVYEFTKAARQVDTMHEREPVGRLIESLYVSPEKLSAMDLSGPPRCAWWAGFEITDAATIARVKSGELSEFSIDCMARRVELPEDQDRYKARITKGANPHDPARPIGRLRDLTIHMLSLVDAGAGKGVRVALYKRATETKMPTIESIMAKLESGEKLSPEEMAALAALIKPPMPIEDAKAEPEKPEAPEVKALRKQLDDAASERVAMAKRLADIEDERAIEKALTAAKSDGLEYLPGVQIAAVVKSLRTLERADKGAAESLRDSLVKAAKAVRESALFKSAGRVITDAATATTWDEFYVARKAEAIKADPAADVIALQKRLAKERPDLFKSRYAAKES